MRNRLVRYLLVATQFVSAAVLVLTAQIKPICYVCLAVAATGAALAVWAWLVMGLGRLTVLPDLRSDAALITTAPYRFVRHPMYSGLLAFCAGLLFTDYDHWKLALWIVLALVLDIKSRIEERLLDERFDDYADYRRRTSRFVPFLY